MFFLSFAAVPLFNSYSSLPPAILPTNKPNTVGVVVYYICCGWFAVGWLLLVRSLPGPITYTDDGLIGLTASL